MTIGKILVIHRGSLGDFLLLLPALTTLRRHYPDARIEMLGRTDILSLVYPGIVDSIGSVERASLVPFFMNSTGLPLKEKDYVSSFDMVFALVSDDEKILAGNLVRLGIKRFIVRPPFPPENDRRHVSAYLLETLGQLTGYFPTPAKPIDSSCPFSFDEAEVRQAEAFLEPARSAGQEIVAIHPGSGSERKCWPPQKYEALIKHLAEENSAPLIILGPADERLVGRMTTLGAELGCPVVNTPPLRQLAALLAKCDAYVGNDSGVTHLAAATGIPTIAIFGPTDPEVWAPRGANVKLVTHRTACSPCSREEMRRCDHRRCLSELHVAEVADSLREILRK